MNKPRVRRRRRRRRRRQRKGLSLYKHLFVMYARIAIVRERRLYYTHASRIAFVRMCIAVLCHHVSAVRARERARNTVPIYIFPTLWARNEITLTLCVLASVSAFWHFRIRTHSCAEDDDDDDACVMRRLRQLFIIISTHNFETKIDFYYIWWGGEGRCDFYYKRAYTFIWKRKACVCVRV